MGSENISGFLPSEVWNSIVYKIFLRLTCYGNGGKILYLSALCKMSVTSATTPDPNLHYPTDAPLNNHSIIIGL
jgi:hypothetical protein